MCGCVALYTFPYVSLYLEKRLLIIANIIHRIKYVIMILFELLSNYRQKQQLQRSLSFFHTWNVDKNYDFDH